jgi:hypothetical protein
MTDKPSATELANALGIIATRLDERIIDGSVVTLTSLFAEEIVAICRNAAAELGAQTGEHRPQQEVLL